MEEKKVIAPLIMKIYTMVDDCSTDELITWTKSNNSFIVHNPSDFCLRLLPYYFKHNNFSSFVRQLNSYGFKKVDQDKWVFANEWFLRGQTHLLHKIVRKKNFTTTTTNNNNNNEDEKKMEMECSIDEILIEIIKAKEGQDALDEQLFNMNKRLEIAEKRPPQIMNLLSQYVEDPVLIAHLIIEKEEIKRLRLENAMFEAARDSGYLAGAGTVVTAGTDSSLPLYPFCSFEGGF